MYQSIAIQEHGCIDHLEDSGGRPLGRFCMMTWEMLISDPFLLFGCCDRLSAAEYSCFSFAGRERRRFLSPPSSSGPEKEVFMISGTNIYEVERDANEE